MIKKVEGIVVFETDYKDTSKMINILTKEEGMIGVLAKGCKRLKSNLSGVGKLTYAQFQINDINNRYSLIEYDHINYFKNIRKDLERISFAAYIIDIINQAYRQEKSQKIYELCINSLIKINDGFNPIVITNILELQLLEFLGIKPVLDSCVCCGKKTDIITLSSYKGGYLCNECLTNEAIVTNKALKLIRMFCYVDISKITKLDISEHTVKEIDSFISEYYDRYSGLYLKSKNFLTKISEINSWK